MAIKKYFVRNYQIISKMKRLIFFFCLTAILFSCTRNPLKINLSGVHVDLKIKHLDVDLLKLKQEDIQTAIPVLKASYGEFFDIFTYRMIGIGGTDQENFPDIIRLALDGGFKKIGLLTEKLTL